MNRFQNECPQVTIVAIANVYSTVTEILENTAAKFAVSYDYPIQQDIDNGIEFLPIPNFTQGRLCLWMHNSNPLANIDELHWSDIDNIKHPFAASSYPLWITSIKEIFRKHGVSFTTRSICQENFLFDMRKDEVQLYDTGFAKDTVLQSFSGWSVKPIMDDDAESLSYIAYRKTETDPALQTLLAFVKSLA